LLHHQNRTTKYTRYTKEEEKKRTRREQEKNKKRSKELPINCCSLTHDPEASDPNKTISLLFAFDFLFVYFVFFVVAPYLVCPPKL
jgi:hypothetical protein